MVMTVLEGHVSADKWEALRETYGGEPTATLPSQMVQTFLVQNMEDPTIWRAVSVWKSRDALAEYRNSVETPGGVLLFRSVGVEPTLTIYDVAVHATADS
jgi:hypothetical protein